MALSRALLRECTRRLTGLMPARADADAAAAAAALPGCFDGFEVVLGDGKKIRNAAKRLKPARGYDGKLLPSFPNWVIDGTRPRRLSWLLKSEALPWIYWNGMLKGHEWMVKPTTRHAA